MKDSLQDQGKRRQLVERLREKGINDERVLQAFADTPRHLFVPASLYAHAYSDAALPIACGQTISQPLTVALQTQLLEVQPKQKILEIGTGSGFQAAILKSMGAYIYTVERQAELYKETEQLFKKLKLPIPVKFGDGYKGWPDFAPYDRILVTCGAPEIPQKLLEQLKPGGIMVIPIGNGEQIMTKIICNSPNDIQYKTYGNYHFVPMLEKQTSFNKK